ncbi:sialate O-acetylesterase [Cerasicoccus arenae]|uniref:Acetylxylan esterase n=1 Tax=Cerasicoccus arenae TaxID=424488 RepID=A0A8J3DEP7_9BACT|nr:sialate O-acetylesterase [Cerasicoccus arenae]MBK1857725.1 sialate O-acetylesterase [Cerasicoccus arenae]GHB91160.1 acetylxylan esterase [Cerasicoccus arenae]
MKTLKYIPRTTLFFCLFVSLIGFEHLSCAEEIELPAKENFHLYLLAGQSNMAGRGQVSEQDKIPHPRVMMLTREGEWAPAVDPLHFDKSIAGVGPGKTFGIEMADDNENVVIGLIPTACGGSSITKWVPGAHHGQTESQPYDDAIVRTKRAMEDGVLKGVLWHQGEADVQGERAENYKACLIVLVDRFRTEFDDPNLPIIIGQLGQFPQKPWKSGTHKVDDAQQEFASETENAGFVSSDGLTCKSDNTHFNAESQREFGRRYAEVYREVTNPRQATN